jgi:hypothetical protein
MTLLRNVVGQIIKAFGGVTPDEVECTRQLYEAWAIQYLTGKNGEVTPNVSHYKPFDNDNIIVIRSQITIHSGMITGLEIAPWCRQVYVTGIYKL